MANRRITVKATQSGDARVTGRPIVRTFGEVFTDGTVIELVATNDADSLNLLLSNRRKTVVGSRIEYQGTVYEAEKLHGSVIRATRFPREPADYGSIRKLFNELATTFEKFLGFSRSEADRASFWVLTT